MAEPENHPLPPGAYVVDGKLFFKLRDGSTLTCECIAQPYAQMIVDLFASANDPQPQRD